MGIFDGVFNTGPQQQAAGDQIRGIQAGYGDLSGLFGQGRGALGTQFGQAGTDLASQFGAGRGTATDFLGSANTAASGALGAGRDALTSNYYAGISPFLQNYATANQGSQALADALGLNGPAGNARAVAGFQNNPGYQFGLDQGEAAIAAQAQKGGMGASGNALMDASKFATNYANQNWNNYINQLSPYLGAAGQAAGGIQQGYSGLGSALGANYGSLGNLLSGNIMGTGNNLLSNYQNLGLGLAGIDTGLGTALNQSFTGQGNAAYGADTSMGNARANADLAQAGANANILGAIGGGAKALFGMLSDETMKDDLEPVGELYDGQRIYRYREKGDPRHKIGLIAQEVEEREPDAVIQFTPHVKGVDYRRATNRAAQIFRMMEAV